MKVCYINFSTSIFCEIPLEHNHFAVIWKINVLYLGRLYGHVFLYYIGHWFHLIWLTNVSKFSYPYGSPRRIVCLTALFYAVWSLQENQLPFNMAMVQLLGFSTRIVLGCERSGMHYISQLLIISDHILQNIWTPLLHRFRNSLELQRSQAIYFHGCKIWWQSWSRISGNSCLEMQCLCGKTAWSIVVWYTGSSVHSLQAALFLKLFVFFGHFAQ